MQAHSNDENTSPERDTVVRLQQIALASALERDDIAAAERSLSVLLEDWRGDPLTLSLHARLLLKRGFTQAASRLLKIATVADPRNVQLLDYCGWAAYECQDLQLAKATFNRLRKYEDDGRSELGLGLIALDEGNLTASRMLLAGARRGGPSEACVAFWSALVEASLSRFDASSCYFRRVLELDPNFSLAKFYLAVLNARVQGRTFSRSTMLEALSGTDPEVAAEWIESYEFLESVGCEKSLAWASRGRNIRFALHAAQVSGCNAEFGVRNGASINIIAEEDSGPVVGFDSFEGLMEPWRNVPVGAYSTYGRMPKVLSNVSLVPGPFSRTVRPWLDAHNPKIKFVHFDCDTFESTLSALVAVEAHLPVGAVLLFDQYVMNNGWQQDEHSALTHWLKSCSRRISYILGSLMTRQVAVRLE